MRNRNILSRDKSNMDASTDFVAEALVEDKLVNLWSSYPCLYDVSSPDFKDREKRDVAFNALSTELDKSVEWVKKKLQALRNSYTKAKKPQSSGSARKKMGKRSAWLIEKLQFLSPFIAARSSVSNLSQEDAVAPNDKESTTNIDETEHLTDDENESFRDEPESPKISDDDMDNDEVQKKSANEPPKERRRTQRKRQAEQEYDLLKCLTESIADRKTKRQKAREDKMNSFAYYVSETLSGLDKNLKHLAQHRINNILFQAQTGTLQPVDQYSFPPQSQPFSQQFPNTQNKQQPYITPSYQSHQRTSWPLQNSNQFYNQPQYHTFTNNDWSSQVTPIHNSLSDDTDNLRLPNNQAQDTFTNLPQQNNSVDNTKTYSNLP